VSDFAVTAPPGVRTRLYIEDSKLKLGVITSTVLMFQ